MDLNSLAFVDCYALSNVAPAIGDWVLPLEAYEAVNPDDEQNAVVPGGPHEWQVTFVNIVSTANLVVAPSFKTDYRPGYESCGIYRLRSHPNEEGLVVVTIQSDYINGSFVCQAIQIQRLPEE